MKAWILHGCMAVCLGVAIMACSPAVAADDSEAVLATLHQKLSGMNSLSCEFVQETRIPLFEKPVITNGRMLLRRPDALLWEYTSPIKEGFALKGTKGFRWEGDKTKRVAFTSSSYPLAGIIANQLLAWATLDLTWIRQEYELSVSSTSPVTLELVPKRPEVRKIITSLTVVLTSEGFAQSVLLKEASGGSTVIRYTKVTPNSITSDAEFE